MIQKNELYNYWANGNLAAKEIVGNLSLSSFCRASSYFRGAGY
jgi:hypothetical protein